MSHSNAGFNRFNEMSDNLAALDGTHNVPFAELFPASFMARYTSFGTMDEMLQKSGFPVESQADFEQIPDDAWDKFVAQNTRFPNWQAMLKQAGEEYVSKKLKAAFGS